MRGFRGSAWDIVVGGRDYRLRSISGPMKALLEVMSKLVTLGIQIAFVVRVCLGANRDLIDNL